MILRLFLMFRQLSGFKGVMKVHGIGLKSIHFCNHAEIFAIVSASHARGSYKKGWRDEPSAFGIVMRILVSRDCSTSLVFLAYFSISSSSTVKIRVEYGLMV